MHADKAAANACGDQKPARAAASLGRCDPLRVLVVHAKAYVDKASSARGGSAPVLESGHAATPPLQKIGRDRAHARPPLG